MQRVLIFLGRQTREHENLDIGALRQNSAQLWVGQSQQVARQMENPPFEIGGF